MSPPRTVLLIALALAPSLAGCRRCSEPSRETPREGGAPPTTTTSDGGAAAAADLHTTDAAAARADSGDFQAFAQSWAAARALSIESWWSADLDGAAPAERVARACPTGFGDGYYLIESDAARRFAIRFTVDGRSRVCRAAPGAAPRPFEEREERHILHPQGAGNGDEELQIALRRGRPVVLRRKLEMVEEPASDEDTGHDHVVVEDWERLVLTHRSLASGTDRRLLDLSAAILPILGPVAAPAADNDAALPPTHNVVVSGRADWSSEFDANIQIAARAQPGGLQLRIEVTDDERRPPPARAPEAAIARFDHIEVWWCDTPEPAPNSDNRLKQSAWSDPALHQHPASCLRGLAVFLTDAGAVETRWLRSPAKTLPQAGGTADAITLDLTTDQLPYPAISAISAISTISTLHLTVLYVDRDAARTSVVGTSRFDRARPETLGLLVDLPGHARFPALGAPAGHAISPVPLDAGLLHDGGLDAD